MATDITEIEHRLASVETALSQVQEKLGLVPAGTNWVERVAGSLEDIPEEDYQQFLECCRTVREGDGAGDLQEPPL